MIGLAALLRWWLLALAAIAGARSHQRQKLQPHQQHQQQGPLAAHELGQYPSAKSCGMCRQREELAAANLRMIKAHILEKLAISHPPNMTGRPVPRIPLIEKLNLASGAQGMQSDQPQDGLYGPEPFAPGMSEHEEVDEFAARTETVFVLAQPHPKLRHVKGNGAALYFNFSRKVLQHRVSRAELSLWVYGSEAESEEEDDDDDDRGYDPREPPVTITVQRYVRSSNESSSRKPRLGPELTTKHRRPVGERGAWVTIEVRKMVAEWFRRPHDNLGLAVRVDGPAAGRKLVELAHDSEHAPYLEVQTQELGRKRIKRNVGLNCEEGSRERRCCRYKLTVDFDKFGWDWIIAPKKYDANYCSGDCPMAFLPVYPNTHIVSLAEPPNNTGPCCAPRKLSEITMLYFDNEYQIVFSRLPGMVVERCGCS